MLSVTPPRNIDQPENPPSYPSGRLDLSCAARCQVYRDGEEPPSKNEKVLFRLGDYFCKVGEDDESVSSGEGS